MNRLCRCPLFATIKFIFNYLRLDHCDRCYLLYTLISARGASEKNQPVIGARPD